MKTKFLFIIILLTAFSADVFSQNKTDNLNGKTFSIQLTKVNGKRAGWDWTSDQISFNADMLISEVMSEHEKFEPAKIFSSKDVDGKIHFKCSSKNHGVSKLEWKGTIKENNIEGTVSWHNAQGTQSYKFTGSLVQSKTN